MIHLLADENMVGLDRLPSSELEIRTAAGRAITRHDLEGIDVLWVRSVTQVTEALVDKSELRFVGTATAGLEHIDQTALTARGIDFSAAPGANANSVVEYVLSALVELEEPWERLEAGEALGVVGYGAVGRLLVSVARTMGWKIRVYDPWLADNGPDEPPEHWSSFADILDCAVISLHCSLRLEQPWPSFHLFDSQALASLHGSQWLVNAARGPVVDRQALRAHLEGSNPVNCVLDVWEGEPDFDSALLDLPALKIASAHIAGYSWDAKWQATRMLYQKLEEAGLVSGSIAPQSDTQTALDPVPGSGLNFARALLAQRYNIRDDDRLFRKLGSLPPGEKAAAFDGLRRQYRQRRELRGASLSGSSVTLCDDNRRI
ncbi:MAG: 4-phosphoerythronate dehydrogenase, partial [Congregibacter sp.]|nr:4-phosphoerythronate dehydrogenase [Congregibacter sp.]